MKTTIVIAKCKKNEFATKTQYNNKETLTTIYIYIAVKNVNVSQSKILPGDRRW